MTGERAETMVMEDTVAGTVVHGTVVGVESDDAVVLTPTLDGGPGGVGAVAKRVLDVALVVLAIVVVLPAMVFAAIGVKVSSPGPVLFRQVRVGRDGRLFTMVKFRTYPVDHVDAAVALPTEACPLRFGRFLRRTSIDELPQLFNVLLGHMSLVGPRPERPRFAEELAARVPGYVERLRAPAGLTGLAQVRGLHGVTSLTDRISADNEYIDRWSFWTDLRILVLTVPTLVRKAR